MSTGINILELDALTNDPETPQAGQVWWKSGVGLGPLATTSLRGFMTPADKQLLQGPLGTAWESGLAVTAHTPNNQTVDYTSGYYWVAGIRYNIASGGTFDLTSIYASLANGERAVVEIYVDADQTLKTVLGTPTSGSKPVPPSHPANTVSMAWVIIGKAGNGSPNTIKSPDISDTRLVVGRSVASIDEQAKVSATDTTTSYLVNKLAAGTNIAISTLNPAANEQLQIASPAFGSSVGTVCQGNDSRLSDNRTDGNAIHKAVSGEIAAMTAKGTPIGADLLVIEDSADSNSKKKIQISTLPTGADPTAIHKAVASEISAMTLKDIPASGDMLVIEDSADSNNKKRITVSSLPAAGALTSSEATATADTTTTSVAYTQMAGMTLTPEAGTYLALFTTSVSSSSANGMIYSCLFANNVQIAATESITSAFKSSDILDTAINKVVTVGAGQAIEIRWKVGSGTGTAKARVLTLVKIG